MTERSSRPQPQRQAQLMREVDQMVQLIEGLRGRRIMPSDQRGLNQILQLYNQEGQINNALDSVYSSVQRRGFKYHDESELQQRNPQQRISREAWN